MLERCYTIVIYPDGDAYSVLVPALPGCVTFGRSPAEAADMAREAIELWFEHLKDRGERCPKMS